MLRSLVSAARHKTLVRSASGQSAVAVCSHATTPLSSSSSSLAAAASQQRMCLVQRRWMSDSPTSSSSSPDPQLFTWGTDHKGSLLQPEIEDGKKADVPTAVEDWRALLDIDEAEITIAQLVCGAKETAIILSDGRCYVSGENKNGQLGLGHKNPVTKPTLLELPPGENKEPLTVQSIALGSNFSAVIDNNGDLYTFGYGGSTLGDGLGFLGHGDGESYLVPKLVESLVEDGCFAKKVQVGTSHMTVLTTEGEVLTCGAGAYGRLGNLETHEDQLFLEPVEMLRSGVTDISGGKSFTLALKDDGVLYGWGKGDKGQLGTGFGLSVDMYSMASVPEPIEADELLGRKVIKVSSGGSHAICVTEGGEVFQWGMTLFLEPVRVSELLHTKIVDVACGDNYSLARDENGKIYSWGTGKTGVLGQGSVKKLNQAQLIEALEDKKITSMSAGWQHAACFAQDA